MKLFKSISENRSDFASLLRESAKNLKAKKSSIGSATMQKIQTLAKLYSLSAEVINLDKLEELITMSAYQEGLNKLRELIIQPANKINPVFAMEFFEYNISLDSAFCSPEEACENFLQTPDALIRFSEEKEDLIALSKEDSSVIESIFYLAVEHDLRINIVHTIRGVGLTLGLSASIANTLANSKEDLEDMINWSNQKLANLTNKVADIVSKEESPELSTEEVIDNMRDNFLNDKLFKSEEDKE